MTDAGHTNRAGTGAGGAGATHPGHHEAGPYPPGPEQGGYPPSPEQPPYPPGPAPAGYPAEPAQAPYAPGPDQVRYPAGPEHTPYAEGHDQAPYREGTDQTPYTEGHSQAPYTERPEQPPYAERHDQAPYAEGYDQAPYAEGHDQAAYAHGQEPASAQQVPPPPPLGQAPEPAPEPEPRRKRKPRRGLRNTVIALVILGGLAVGADRLAVNFAESEAADKIKSTQGLNITPKVSIKGFPFLTQALNKELDEVEVNLDGMETDTDDGRSIRVTELRATLHQVRISGDFSSATADRATGRAHISYADLSAYAGPGVTISYAGKSAEGKSQVKITGSMMGFSLSVDGTVSVVNGDTIRLRANTIPDAVPKRFESQVRRQTDFDRKIDGLPAGIRLEGVESTPEGVDIPITGSGVNLAG